MNSCYDQLLCYSKIPNGVSIFTELHYYVNIHAHPNRKVYILCVDNLSNLCTVEVIQCEWFSCLTFKDIHIYMRV